MIKRLFMLALVGVMLISTPIDALSVQATMSTTSTIGTLAEQVTTTLDIISRDAKGNLNLNDKVTRAQYARMLVKASPYKDKVGKVSTALYKDVKKNYWGAPYIKIAVDCKWMSGNIYGKFRPASYITLQEAVNGVIALLGYEDSDFTGNKAAARMSLYTAEDLDKSITKAKNQYLTKKDCMNLFYNTLVANTKAKEVYAKTLGYEIDSSGDVNYLSLVNDKMKGPIIGEPGWRKSIPFSTTNAIFYRNGKSSKASALKKYDVLYYSKPLKTIWAYNNKVTGNYEEAIPSRLSPEKITIAGKTYEIGSQDASYQLSTMGKYNIGDNISILLGKDDSVVGIVEAGKVNTSVGGVVIKKGNRTNNDDDGDETLEKYITVVDVNGAKHNYNSGTTDFLIGDAVQISYVSGKTVINKLVMNKINGKINNDASKLSTFDLADDIKILDMFGEIYGSIPKKRLENVTLYSSDVLYYKLNGDNIITELILSDVTGDIYTYGILLNANEVGNAIAFTGTYLADINGVQKTFSTLDYIMVNTTVGPSQFRLADNTLMGLKTLRRTDITAVSGLSILNGKESYLLSDKVVVYLVDELDKYYVTKLSKVSNLNNYNLRAYYDKAQSLGGRVRIIEARIRK